MKAAMRKRLASLEARAATRSADKLRRTLSPAAAAWIKRNCLGVMVSLDDLSSRDRERVLRDEADPVMQAKARAFKRRMIFGEQGAA